MNVDVGDRTGIDSERQRQSTRPTLKRGTRRPVMGTVESGSPTLELSHLSPYSVSSFFSSSSSSPRRSSTSLCARKRRRIFSRGSCRECSKGEAHRVTEGHRKTITGNREIRVAGSARQVARGAVRRLEAQNQVIRVAFLGVEAHRKRRVCRKKSEPAVNQEVSRKVASSVGRVNQTQAATCGQLLNLHSRLCPDRPLHM